jgi:Flp pilus assembly protein TadG
MRAHRGGDAGAAAVEFALILPLFVMLTVGTISAGFAFHHWIGITQGVREGARFGATLSVQAAGGTTDQWLQQVGDRTIAASGLWIDSTHDVPKSTVCVGLNSPSAAPTISRHVTISTDASGTPTSAFANGLCPGLPTVTGDYVQVSASRPAAFNYVVHSSSITVDSASVVRYEATAVT